jgi:hypothetical protein
MNARRKKLHEVVLLNWFSRTETGTDYKVKINAKWHLLPHIRHANSNMAVTQMLAAILVLPRTNRLKRNENLLY